MNTENYTHLAVNKFTNLIVNGWDYADVEPSELKEFKNDYFIVDLKDYGFNPKVYKIVTSKFAEKNGINQWSNTGVYPLEEEYKMKDEGINFSEKAYEEHPDWFYEDVSESIKRNNTNKDMKQTIKLSESELKKIVAESVKRALKEDREWVKFADASHKRWQNGNKDDALKLMNHAAKRFNDEHSYDNGEEFYKGAEIGTTVNDMQPELGSVRYKYGEQNTGEYFPKTDFDDEFDFGTKYSDELNNRRTIGDEELSSYYNGKLKYVPGKGWSNESITKKIDRIVAESVKGAINELDWKTYASAAKKRAEQGASDYDVHQLDQAANKALSDKYKITGDGHFPYSPQIDTRKGESVYDTDEEGNYVKKYPHAGQTGRFPQLGYQGDFNDTYYTPIGDNVEDEPYERTTYDNYPTHKERHKDMSSYFSGKSKYEKGKGWSNESITKKIDKIVSETLKRTLSEGMTPEDKWVADEEADEDMRYEMGELNKAFQKANNTYQATSKDGNFKTGDKVIVHTRKGDIEGVIADFDVNFMTYKETADVEYNENGRTRTLLGCPLDKIEKIG